MGQVLSACREGPAAPHHGAPASLLRLPLGKELVLLEQGSQRGGQLWQLSLAMAFCPVASERRLWRALRSLWPETPPPPRDRDLPGESRVPLWPSAPSLTGWASARSLCESQEPRKPYAPALCGSDVRFPGEGSGFGFSFLSNWVLGGAATSEFGAEACGA